MFLHTNYSKIKLKNNPSKFRRVSFYYLTELFTNMVRVGLRGSLLKIVSVL